MKSKWPKVNMSIFYYFDKFKQIQFDIQPKLISKLKKTLNYLYQNMFLDSKVLLFIKEKYK